MVSSIPGVMVELNLKTYRLENSPFIILESMFIRADYPEI